MNNLCHFTSQDHQLTADGKVQFTTLQNVVAPNVTLPLPETSAITFQRIKVEQSPEKVEAKPIVKQQIFKLPTLSNTTTSTTSTNAAQAKTTVRKTMTKTTVVTAKPNHKVNAIKSESTDSNTTTNLVTTQSINTGSGGSAKSEVPTCEICDKVFKRKEHLAQHVKLHLGLRPFKCEEPNCNKAFSRKEHLMRHCVSVSLPICYVFLLFFRYCHVV